MSVLDFEQSVCPTGVLDRGNAVPKGRSSTKFVLRDALTQFILPEGDNQIGCTTDFAIAAVTSGATSCQFVEAPDREIQTLSRGALILINSRETRRWVTDSACGIILLNLPRRAITAFGEHAFENLYGRSFRDLFIFHALLRMAEERFERGATCQELLTSTASILITALQLRNERIGPLKIRRRGQTRRGIREALDWVEDNLAERITTSRLAEVAGLSEWNFLRAFKRYYELPPHRYVLDLRLSKCREMLTDSDVPISHIAYECGFSSQSHMTTAFKLQFGVTPGRFRSAPQSIVDP